MLDLDDGNALSAWRMVGDLSAHERNLLSTFAYACMDCRTVRYFGHEGGNLGACECGEDFAGGDTDRIHVSALLAGEVKSMGTIAAILRAVNTRQEND